MELCGNDDNDSSTVGVGTGLFFCVHLKKDNTFPLLPLGRTEIRSIETAKALLLVVVTLVHN